MHWVYLMAAIALEVGGTTSMKLSEGFSRLLPSILVFVLYGSCLGMLTLAFEKLPISVAYTAWGSVGTVLVVIVGKMFFDEQLSALQVASIVLVIIGVIGINVGRTGDEVGPRDEQPAATTEEPISPTR